MSNPLMDVAAGLMSGSIKVVDLSVTLNPETPILQLPEEFGWKNAWPFAMEEISCYDERGPAWYWNNIKCGEHTGTHFDAPIHWVTGKDHENHAT
ncbi:MAG: cyclase family protein, partial [Luminiphilus sp.]